MGLESLSFVNIEWMKQLYRQLKQFTDERAQELDQLGDDFYSESPVNNPVVDKEPVAFQIVPSVTYHVVRGGAWESSASFCRFSCRNHFEPDVRFHHIGFRVVRDLEK